MVITRSNHDLTTTYLYYWSEEIIACAQQKKIPVIDLAKKRANRKDFASIIRKTHPSLVVINGHGDDFVVMGYDNEPLVEAKVNESLLKNTIVYARSCRSAKTLGPSCINSGCHAYIGYQDDFVFFIENEKITHPLDDKTAKMFIEPSNNIVTSLLKGHPAKETNSRSKEIYKRSNQKLTTSATTKEERELIPYLVWNYNNQVCLGDGDVAI